MRQILDWLAADAATRGPTPRGVGETVVTIGERPQLPFPIEKLRHLFVEADEQAEIAQLRASSSSDKIIHLCAPFDYIEDESGKRISEPGASVHLMRKTAGPNYVLWDLETMLSGGAKPMVDAAAWSMEKANTLSHFLRVVEAIFRSSWYRQPLHLSFRTSESSTEVVEVQVPNDESTRAICMCLRQLFSDYKGDQLMRRACEIYGAHSGEQLRAMWTNDQRTRFKKFLESPPPFGGITDTVAHLFESFLYGCNIMHAKSSHGAEAQLLALCRKYGKERVAMEVQSGFRFLAGIAAQAYHVIKLDFDAWMASGAHAKPSTLSATDFLSSWRKGEGEEG